MSVPEAAGPLSVVDFARRVGVDEQAVRKAIRSGRLEAGVLVITERGKVAIADVARAEAQWRANRDDMRGLGAGGVRGTAGSRTLAHERRRLLRAQVRRANLEIQKQKGALVNRRALETRYATRVITARTKLLGVPSRAKQRLPHLTDADVAELAALIREALEELAGEA